MLRNICRQPLCALLVVLLFQFTASAQVFYTFTSGPMGDGISWPASPTGLLDGDFFFTFDGVSFDNFSGNNVFFDDNYQVASNSPDIDGDAMWGNPNGGTVDIYLTDLGTQSVSFSFAHSVGGEPFLTDDFVDIYVEDSDGRATFFSQFLGNTFTGLGGFDGYSDIVQFDTSFLMDDDMNVDGGPLIDIDYFYIDLFSLDNTTDPAEFAIDNLSTDGGGGGPGQLYPSVNDGQFDVSDSTLGANSLRGTGTYGSGIEVTNNSPNATTYTVQITPGGDLTAGALPTNAPIAPGESIFTADQGSIDRSLPSGTYESVYTVINNGDPTDPDDTVTLSIDLYEPQSLSGNFTGVDVNSSEDVTLSNAIAPVDGFRAAVRVIGAETTGPFTVDEFPSDNPTGDQRLLDGESIQANVLFNRFGQLSGLRVGTHTVELEQTAYVINEFVDLRTVLENTEPVPDATWALNYTLVNTNTDNANFSPGSPYAERFGVNRFEVAATLIDGTSSKNQNVGMQFTTDPDPSSADIIGDPVDLVFGGGDGDPYVLQFTYDEALVPSGSTESDLLLLWYDSVAGEWKNAIDGNSSGTATPFLGSWADYLAGPGGGSFDAGDLGAFGVDVVNNHVWAALDHASLFAVGVLASGGTLAGDYNNDGQVDLADYTIWRNNLGAPAGTLPNDVDGGTIGTAQYVTWRAFFGQSSPVLSTDPVPEPSAAWLLVAALLPLARSRRWNKS